VLLHTSADGAVGRDKKARARGKKSTNIQEYNIFILNKYF